MIITLSGVPGSGKTTIAKLLSEQLHLPYHSIGSLRRQFATEQGMDLQTYNETYKDLVSEDKKIDEYQTTLGKKQDDFIIDGRMSWYFIPHSYKIFLNADLKEAAKRIFLSSQKGERLEEPAYHSLEETQKAVEARLQGDRDRYLAFYHTDYLAHSNYDLVIDTTDKTPQEIVDRITQVLAKKRKPFVETPDA